jgi:hypothetical protein
MNKCNSIKAAKLAAKIKEREAKNFREEWEKLNGFYDDGTGMLYCNDKSCYDCRRKFDPAGIDIPMLCGQMLIDGVEDAEVFRDTTCKLFLD